MAKMDTACKKKINLKELPLSALERVVLNLAQPAYRAKQIEEWLYKKNVCDIADMSNLPKSLRQDLSSSFTAAGLKMEKRQASNDGTIKYLFMLSDGNTVETVYIPDKTRGTICLSTQVGCRFACSFCATGSQRFTRGLFVSEILNQVIEVKNDIKDKPLTNIVFMGMGEPLDNFGPLNGAIAVLHAKNGFGFGVRRMTVSTAGVAPKIGELGKLWPGLNLAVSLHSARNETRTKLMPINKKYPVDSLLKECADYPLQLTRKITMEIILFNKVNDSDEEAKTVIEKLKPLQAKVNLITFNNIKELRLTPSPREKVNRFQKLLTDAGIKTTIRKSRGGDIEAACGQLRSSSEKEKKEG